MDSNGSNSSSGNKKSFKRGSFTDGFEQLLSVEVSPQLWITIQKSKTSQGNLFVDIRRRKEGQWKGNKILLPIKKTMNTSFFRFYATFLRIDYHKLNGVS